MFGFPEHLSDWNAHHYLRIFTFIIVYIAVRPLVQKMYTRLGERQREREKAQYEDEQIRKHRQTRIREKLGIVSADGSDVLEPSGSSTAQAPAAAAAAPAVRQRTQPPKAAARSTAAKSKKDEIAEAMESDEDVSDLLS